MSTKSSTSCTFFNCRALVRHSAHYKDDTADDIRSNDYQRGYGGKAWGDLRRQVIERDQGISRECNALGARQIAPIVARRQGGPEHPDNLRLLCNSCHSRETALNPGFGCRDSGFSVGNCLSARCARRVAETSRCRSAPGRAKR